MPSCQANKPVKYELCETHDGESRDRFCSDHCGIICGVCTGTVMLNLFQMSVRH